MAEKIATTRDDIYCFAMFCEDKDGLKNIKTHAVVESDEREAKYKAMLKLLEEYPSEQGWRYHQMETLKIPRQWVLSLANVYLAGDF